MSFFAERLTVLDNPRADRVRRVSGLVGRSARSRSGQMLVEGPQAVRELALHRPDAVRDVYVREDAWETHADVVDVARRATRWVHPVTAEVSAALSGDSQGICAVASLDALSRELPEPSVGETIVVLAQGRDPGNVGTIIRTADAFGAVGVVAVAGTVDAASPKVVRSSAGSVFHIPVPMPALLFTVAARPCWAPAVVPVRSACPTSSCRECRRARVCPSRTRGCSATRHAACRATRCACATPSCPFP